MGERLLEFPDRRVWDLKWFTLDQICLDYRVTLLLAQPQSSVTVIIETPFILRLDLRSVRIVPDQILSTVPMLPLLHQTLVALTAFRDGRLLLQFEEGTEIEVQKDAQYEAWETYGDGETADVGMLCSGHEGSPWGG